MEIKASVKIIEGGFEESVNFSVKSERYDKKRGLKVKSNFDINFKMIVVCFTIDYYLY